MNGEKEKGYIPIETRIDEMEKKIDAIYASVEKTRKIIFWSGIATLVTFVLPLIIVAIIFPKILNGITEIYGINSTEIIQNESLQNIQSDTSLSQLLRDLQEMR